MGDTVKKGDLLAEVETDKATMELESYQDGTLLYVGAQNGEKVDVNALLAILGKPGENVDDLVKQNGGQAAPAAENKTEAPKEEAPKADAPKEAPKAEKPAASGMDLSTVEEAILMPRLSDTMTEGVIAAWHKKVGDSVKKGELLAEVETDKATMELESYKDGTLLYIGAEKGDKVPVNALLCIIGNDKTNVDAIVAAAKGGGIEAKGEGDVKGAAGTPASSVESKKEEANKESDTTSENVSSDGRIKASPLAKKIAAEKGIDITKVTGTGDNGRIVKSDVDNYVPTAEKSAAAPAAKTTAAPAVYGQESFEEKPVSQMRKVIAKRLSESLFTAPHFYVTMSIDMDKAVESRAKMNETAPVKISFNDMVLKAVALSLKQHPAVNSSWLGDKIRTNHHVNIGVAVAVDEGLLVPVVRFADTKSLSQIGAEVKDFAKRAKDKKLQPADWEGSTFTISNLGMFGVDEFTAIINPPDACILAVGGISQVPVVKDGQIKVGNVMKVTLSCDHRVVDGATGAAFLQTVKSLLEEPVRMLV